LITDTKCVACPNNSSILITNKQCLPCVASKNVNDKKACLIYHKYAANTTEGIANANNTTAQGGDIITYTLTVTNAGNADYPNFVFHDDISDILEYATPLNLHAGKLDQTGEVTWPAITVKASTTSPVQFTVKVMNPVPQTPANPTTPTSHDLIMNNVYGDVINIHLPCGAVRCGETAASSLPNTGPGTTLFISAAIVVVAGYFFARSRLLATEANIALHDGVPGGL